MSSKKLLFCYHLPTRGRAGVKLGDAWYVSNVSIIFDAPCLFIHHLLCVLFTLHGIFMQFPELTFCSFCVSEKLQRKYSRNWMKQKLKSLITWHEDGVQRRAGDEPEADRTYWWRGPPLGRVTRGCDRLVHPLTSPFHLFNPLDGKTLGAQNLFQKTYYKPPPSSTRDREGPEALPGTLPERGITTGGLLHHHACLQSNVWVVYLRLRVHSSS
jgi:hypothetical protein